LIHIFVQFIILVQGGVALNRTSEINSKNQRISALAISDHQRENNLTSLQLPEKQDN
jgi:hypothetical protein